jgi:hypothetical protein
MESGPQAVDRSTSPAAAGELLVRHSYMASEIERLFEADSPLLHENPYALAAPLNTMRARRSDVSVRRGPSSFRVYILEG